METQTNNYWKFINSRIKELGTTQEAVCSETGINYQTFRGMVTKEILPRLPDAYAIAKVLKLSVDYTWTQKDDDTAFCFYRRYGKYEDVLKDYDALSPRDKSAINAAINTFKKC